MVSSQKIEAQLKKIGCHYTFWGSSEVAELTKLLMDGEEIALAVNGYYEGGFGLLVATNFRVLIVDKKPFVLNVEDLRYEMITEVTYGARLLIAEMRIAIPTRTIYFDSWSMEKLHQAMRYVQQHVLDARDGGAGARLPTDWFRTRAAELGMQQIGLTTAAKVASIARSALRGVDDLAVKSPNIGHSSALHGVNPYGRRSTTTLRRRLPALYN